MKLLYVQDSLGTGGAERSNAELWYYLRTQTSYEIKIVVLEHRKVGIEDEILNENFDVIFLQGNSFLSHVLQLRKIIARFQPDIVQSVLFRSAIRVRTVRMLIDFYHIEFLVNCSFSKTRYADPKINKSGLNVFKFINRLTQGRGTDKFIAITQEVKDHVEEHLKIPENKIEIIPRGRRKNPFLSQRDVLRKELLSELKTKEPALLFIHVGRQEYQKGHLDLLKALTHLPRLSDSNVHFLFCGRTGNESKAIEVFLADNKLDIQVHWLGHRNDIEKLLVASDVFVFPSRWEGLGGALIEAQAAGLPVICSDIKVFEEVVLPGKNALMFEMGKEKELSAKIERLATDIELRESMGLQSLKNYQEKFEINEIHSRTISLYRKVIS